MPQKPSQFESEIDDFPLPSPPHTTAHPRQEAIFGATDEELLIWAQGGNNAALGELLHRNRERIYAVARHYTKTREDADDLVQETMLRAVRNLQNFRREARFSSWLTAIAIHAAISDKRKNRNRQWISIEENPQQGDMATPIVIAEHRPNPEQAFQRHESQALLRHGMAQIVPAQRQLLQIIYFDETSVKDVAAQLGIATGTAKSRLRRARLQLARELKRNSRFAFSSKFLRATLAPLSEAKSS